MRWSAATCVALDIYVPVYRSCATALGQDSVSRCLAECLNQQQEEGACDGALRWAVAPSGPRVSQVLVLP